MKIKAVENYVNAVTGEVFRIGHEYDITDEHAAEYIAGKLAEAVEVTVEVNETTKPGDEFRSFEPAVEPVIKKARKAK